MTRQGTRWIGIAVCAALIGLMFGGVTRARAAAATSTKRCPYILNLRKDVTMELVNVKFTDEVQGVGGNRMKIRGERLKVFRIAIATLKITKPRGKRLSVTAADFTMHYYHGSNKEVAPSEGLSAFSTQRDFDRPMTLPRMSGPGFTRQTTGSRTTKAGIVYVDVVFSYMEPDTREVWVCYGRPIQTRPFITEGWAGK